MMSSQSLGLVMVMIPLSVQPLSLSQLGDQDGIVESHWRINSCRIVLIDTLIDLPQIFTVEGASGGLGDGQVEATQTSTVSLSLWLVR